MTAWKTTVYLHSMLATSLPAMSLRSNKGITLLVPKVKTNTGKRGFHSCVPSLWNNLLLSGCSATSTEISRKYLKMHLFLLGLSAIDTSTPNGPLMLQNCFISFAEHQFRCHTTEPGYAGHIGTIGIWFDWLIDWLNNPLHSGHRRVCCGWSVSPFSVWLGLVFCYNLCSRHYRCTWS